ncbi:hypothetical protein RB620_22210 [Paenibacillus sp. LHD-117]|uniref:hypothetical protein n=1 Tax=Paenibacillus sp. LHD-117 TaxID=3071412 RepID=UPI0027DF64DA|nr:hypothetical protein [Paenibacillus sp. LHD-117]MDQ6422149.1 hypothetical protein [Paenibacillus sp. LHD-117]
MGVIDVTGLTNDQRQALAEAATCLRAALSDEGIPVHYEEGDGGIAVQYDGQAAVVSCGGGSQFVRAFGLTVEGIRKGEPFSVQETPWYDNLGVMIDCSRNAVLHMDAFQSIVRRLALMGYTTRPCSCGRSSAIRTRGTKPCCRNASRLARAATTEISSLWISPTSCPITLRPAEAWAIRCPGKYLLYQDVLYGLFDKHVQPAAYKEHYYRSAALLKAAAGRNPEWRSLFETQAALCRLLELKATAGIEIREAYHSSDKEELGNFVDTLLPELKARAELFVNMYKKQWMQENKIFGLDVFDLRMGGLLQRIETAIHRIGQYVRGEVQTLEELDEPILTFDAREDGESKVISVALWHTIATPSVLAGI